MLIAAIALKPRLGWPILLAAAGAAWTVLPLVDIAVRGAATPILAGGDVTMMAAGVLFAVAAWRGARKHA
jgi:hypothetical protein